MKSYFQKCSICGAEVMLSETQNIGIAHVLCRDSLACDRRRRQNDTNHLAALNSRLRALEAQRSEIIEAIGDWYKRTGTPNPIDERHKAEMAKIEMEG